MMKLVKKSGHNSSIVVDLLNIREWKLIQLLFISWIQTSQKKRLQLLKNQWKLFNQQSYQYKCPTQLLKRLHMMKPLMRFGHKSIIQLLLKRPSQLLNQLLLKNNQWKKKFDPLSFQLRCHIHLVNL